MHTLHKKCNYFKDLIVRCDTHTKFWEHGDSRNMQIVDKLRKMLVSKKNKSEIAKIFCQKNSQQKLKNITEKKCTKNTQKKRVCVSPPPCVSKGPPPHPDWPVIPAWAGRWVLPQALQDLEVPLLQHLVLREHLPRLPHVGQRVGSRGQLMILGNPKANVWSVPETHGWKPAMTELDCQWLQRQLKKHKHK